MCTRLQWNSRKKIYYPCGKCEECIKARANSITQVLVDAAKRAKDVHFITFTYSDDRVPLFYRDLSLAPKKPETPVRDPEESDSNWEIRKTIWKEEKKEYYDWYKDNPGRRPTPDLEDELRGSYDFPNVHTKKTVYTVQRIGKYQVAMSLDNKDISNVMKQFREEWYRKTKQRLKFKYHVIGEYGTQTARPHFHGQFFNLTDEQVDLLTKIWQRRHGFTVTEKLERSEKSFINNCRYVSNYLNKASFECQAVTCYCAQKGRIQCSAGLAFLTAAEIAYYSGADLGLRKDQIRYTDEDLERVWRRIYDTQHSGGRVLGNVRYKLGDKYKKMSLYDKKKITFKEHPFIKNETIRYVPTRLSQAITDFVQRRIVSDVQEQFGEFIANVDSENLDKAIIEELRRGTDSLRARERVAKDRLRKVLSKDKF